MSSEACVGKSRNICKDSVEDLIVHPFLPCASESPAILVSPNLDIDSRFASLVLQDGSIFTGYTFGANKSVSGELVFQTGMVGYPESLTDPSYKSQILVFTYPLVGNYGVSEIDWLEDVSQSLPKYFESNKIHLKAIVVSTYSTQYSHHLAKSSLSQWLKENGVLGLFGIDTRAITKKIREEGSFLAKIQICKSSEDESITEMLLKKASNGIYLNNWLEYFEFVDWYDPNLYNLVAEVSTKKEYCIKPDPNIKSPYSGLKISVLDLGLKYNQLRCFIKHNVEIKVFPWNTDISKLSNCDGLFLSNGPGDPSLLTEVINNIKSIIEKKSIPIFGICLGHQLLAHAAGAKTSKMKFGNRACNIPCTSTISQQCFITSQNHGYAVDATTLPDGWKTLFFNANDLSNEGVIHLDYPFFSVQFHPESAPGPKDTEYFFTTFLDAVLSSKAKGSLQPLQFPLAEIKNSHRVNVRKTLILGSGGLSIGQAGEFDYSGSQAIKALKEEGIYTVLINPNIATIQTSKGLADKVYFLPVTPDFVRKVIHYERPDSIYVTFGGQTALNVGVALKDELESLNVRVLGTSLDSVIVTEDRELFSQSMAKINEFCAKSASASSIEEALIAGNEIGYPVIVRAAYALGGLGSGFAENDFDLTKLCEVAFASTHQVLIERSMKGWKEIEYEVVRDAYDNCVTVCNMENFDPLGIHTGDSIVIAPSQTLSNTEYYMLRDTAIRVIRHLKIVGECNIQYALNPDSHEYCIIEVNARLSRSSALASKATGYPLAFIAAKLGLGIPLPDVKNSVTQVTTACFEPSLDYVVIKIPRWDLKKFTRVSSLLSSSMKSVGEVMSIGRTFEEAMQKAIRAIDDHNTGFMNHEALMSIETELQTPSDQRLFAIANAFSEGYSVDQIWKLTRIDKWFLARLEGLVNYGTLLSKYTINNIPSNILRQSKQLGFSDRQIARFINSNDNAVRKLRIQYEIRPYVKQIDTLAAEFPAHTNYLYLTYNSSEDDIKFEKSGVIVLGSGAYRIGSSVEFDWCAVRAARKLREMKIYTILINYNPETVSTDYDEFDRLYFENLDVETILEVYDKEVPDGIIISMGGQTPNNLALSLSHHNVKILGTSPKMIDSAENRYKFSRLLDQLEVDQPAWKELTNFDDSLTFCSKVGYPVIVRPSYVLSGAAMNTVFSKNDLISYLKQAAELNKDHPVVISKYIENAKEIEMDAVAKDGIILAQFVSEHIENAGVHSGDATLVHPPQDLDNETIFKLKQATAKIADALNVTGPMNIQFIAKNNEIKVIECNVRASRSFPFVSKVENLDLVELATLAIMNRPIDQEILARLKSDEKLDKVAVKVPQFSFSRLQGADPVSGVEMASTGEVACFGKNKFEAYLKAYLASNMSMPKKNILLSIGSYSEKVELLPIIKNLNTAGFNFFATAGTSDFLAGNGVPCQYLEVLDQEGSDIRSEYSLSEHLSNHLIDIYVNLPSRNKFRRPANYVSKGYLTRRMAVDYSIPLVTNIKVAKILFESILQNFQLEVSPTDYITSNEVSVLPPLINIATFTSNGSNEAIIKAINSSSQMGFLYHNVILNKTLSDSDFEFLGREIMSKSDVNFSITCNVLSASKSSGAVFISKDLDEKMLYSEILSQYDLSQILVFLDSRSPILSTILLIASLNKWHLHVLYVNTIEKLKLISQCKSKDMSITCDVAALCLFYSSENVENSSDLFTEEEIHFLWNNLDMIDCLSLNKDVFDQVVANSKIENIEEAKLVYSLLLNAVNLKSLSRQVVVEKLSNSPARILGITLPKESFIEIEMPSILTSKDFKFYVLQDAKLLESSHFKFSRCFESPKLAFEEHSKLPSRRFDIQLHTLRREKSASLPLKGRDESLSPKVLNIKSLNVADSPSVAPLIHEDFQTLPSMSLFASHQQHLHELITTINNANCIRGKSIVSVTQFSRESLQQIFHIATDIQKLCKRYGIIKICESKILMTMFYEPSTRTQSSFLAAMERLGGRVIAVDARNSSVTKGESLQDTVRTLSQYADALVIRHPSEDSAKIAASASSTPIINGGNGTLEHPTQALLDLYTIREELGTLNGHVITFLGDLKNGRTVHSLVRVLCLFKINELNFIAPKQLRIPKSLREFLSNKNIAFSEYDKLEDEVIQRTDVLYCTRVQKERFADNTEYETLKDVFRIDNKCMTLAKSNMIVMHPLPRNAEIAEELDLDQRVAMFRAMEYGMFVRMALLAMVLGCSMPF